MGDPTGGDEECSAQTSDRRPTQCHRPPSFRGGTRGERLSIWLNRLGYALAIAWTLVVIGELAFPVSPGVQSLLLRADLLIWLAYAIVFLLQVALATDRRDFLRQNVLIAIAIALPALRIAPLIGLIGVARPAWLVRLLLTWNQAISRIRDVFEREYLYVALGVLGVSTVISAAAVYFFEHDVPGSPFSNFGEAIWWAATLATTINTSSDPVTVEGRIVGWVLRAIALAFFGYVAGSIASYMVTERTGETKRVEEQEDALARLSGEVAELRALLAELESELRLREDPPRSR